MIVVEVIEEVDVGDFFGRYTLTAGQQYMAEYVGDLLRVYGERFARGHVDTDKRSALRVIPGGKLRVVR